MAISEHKSVGSLAIYQKVSEDEKLCMGMSMSYYLNCDNPVIYTPPTIDQNVQQPLTGPHNLQLQ